MMKTFVTMIIHNDIMIMIVKNQELFIIDVFSGTCVALGRTVEERSKPPCRNFLFGTELVERWVRFRLLRRDDLFVDSPEK